MSERDDIAEALASWEPGQLDIGEKLVRRARAMGTRVQIDNTWVPGDPDNRLGLYGPDIQGATA